MKTSSSRRRMISRRSGADFSRIEPSRRSVKAADSTAKPRPLSASSCSGTKAGTERGGGRGLQTPESDEATPGMRAFA